MSARDNIGKMGILTRSYKCYRREGILRTTQYSIGLILDYFIHPNKRSSERYVEFLRSSGVEIGEGTQFFGFKSCHVDVTRPSLITIGKNVKITRGTKILTHDYAGSVFKHKYGQYIDSAGEIKINDNVYIGNNVTILKNVEVGENVIISANSLVNKDIPPNTVAGGVPAKKIMDLEQYYEKRKNECLGEAKTYAKSIEQRFNRRPREDDFSGFSHIFTESKYSEPMYDSFESFLQDCDTNND